VIATTVNSNIKEEAKTSKSNKSNSNSKINRKRRKTAKPVKSDEKCKTPEKGNKDKMQTMSWGLSDVCKSTSSGTKRFKKEEVENFDISAEISI